MAWMGRMVRALLLAALCLPAGAGAQELDLRLREYTVGAHAGGTPTRTSAADIQLFNNGHRLACCQISAQWISYRSNRREQGSSRLCVFPGRVGTYTVKGFVPGSLRYQGRDCQWRD